MTDDLDLIHHTDAERQHVHASVTLDHDVSVAATRRPFACGDLMAAWYDAGIVTQLNEMQTGVSVALPVLWALARRARPLNADLWVVTFDRDQTQDDLADEVAVGRSSWCKAMGLLKALGIVGKSSRLPRSLVLTATREQMQQWMPAVKQGRFTYGDESQKFAPADNPPPAEPEKSAPARAPRRTIPGAPAPARAPVRPGARAPADFSPHTPLGGEGGEPPPPAPGSAQPRRRSRVEPPPPSAVPPSAEHAGATRAALLTAGAESPRHLDGLAACAELDSTAVRDIAAEVQKVGGKPGLMLQRCVAHVERVRAASVPDPERDRREAEAAAAAERERRRAAEAVKAEAQRAEKQAEQHLAIAEALAALDEAGQRRWIEAAHESPGGAMRLGVQCPGWPPADRLITDDEALVLAAVLQGIGGVDELLGEEAAS